MAVDSKHPLYVDNLHRWKLVNDVCDGSQSIKNMGVQYLPVVNACATNEETSPITTHTVNVQYSSK